MLCTHLVLLLSDTITFIITQRRFRHGSSCPIGALPWIYSTTLRQLHSTLPTWSSTSTLPVSAERQTDMSSFHVFSFDVTIHAVQHLRVVNVGGLMSTSAIGTCLVDSKPHAVSFNNVPSSQLQPHTFHLHLHLHNVLNSFHFPFCISICSRAPADQGLRRVHRLVPNCVRCWDGQSGRL
jgi:hypothetical protein